jgi:hypothetical protein
LLNEVNIEPVLFDSGITRADRIPVRSAKPKPSLEVKYLPENASILLGELHVGQSSELKAQSLISFSSRYHFEETTAAQQAQMLIAIKLQMAPDVNDSELFPFR